MKLSCYSPDSGGRWGRGVERSLGRARGVGAYAVDDCGPGAAGRPQPDSGLYSRNAPGLAPQQPAMRGRPRSRQARGGRRRRAAAARVFYSTSNTLGCSLLRACDLRCGPRIDISSPTILPGPQSAAQHNPTVVQLELISILRPAEFFQNFSARSYVTRRGRSYVTRRGRSYVTSGQQQWRSSRNSSSGEEHQRRYVTSAARGRS